MYKIYNNVHMCVYCICMKRSGKMEEKKRNAERMVKRNMLVECIQFA